MLKSLAFVEWIHLYVWHKTATARSASRNKTITKTSLQCASPDQHANDCSFIEIQWMYISKHWSTEPIQQHFIHFNWHFVIFMHYSWDQITMGSVPKQEPVAVVIPNHDDGALFILSLISMWNQHTIRKQIFLLKKHYNAQGQFKNKKSLFYHVHFFLGDAIVSFNEIIALINKKKMSMKWSCF